MRRGQGGIQGDRFATPLGNLVQRVGLVHQERNLIGLLGGWQRLFDNRKGLGRLAFF